MLKSKATGDSRRNTNLQNLKLLSTSRYSAITDHRLENIDEVLREIEAETCDCTQIVTPVPDISALQDPVQDVSSQDTDECNTTTEDTGTEIPVLMTIQYSNALDIIGAVEGYLNSNRQLYEQQGTHMIVCPQCESTEVKHAEQIAEISRWRKSFMSSLNLKTVTHV